MAKEPSIGDGNTSHLHRTLATITKATAFEAAYRYAGVADSLTYQRLVTAAKNAHHFVPSFIRGAEATEAKALDSENVELFEDKGVEATAADVHDIAGEVLSHEPVEVKGLSDIYTSFFADNAEWLSMIGGLATSYCAINYFTRKSVKKTGLRNLISLAGSGTIVGMSAWALGAQNTVTKVANMTGRMALTFVATKIGTSTAQWTLDKASRAIQPLGWGTSY